jgi:hypothetical protein
MENTPWHEPSAAEFCFLPVSICQATSFDTMAFAVAFWATGQLTWTLFVLGGQLFQISRQLTTFELSNLGRYGYMGGHASQGLSGHGPARPGMEHTLSTDGLPVHAHAHGAHHGHRHGRSALSRIGAKFKKLPGSMLHLVGLDLYTRGKAGEGMRRADAAANPFDQGLRRNCEDFWTRGRALDVDYMTLYEIPDAGLGSRARRTKSESKTRSRGMYEMVPSDASASV